MISLGQKRIIPIGCSCIVSFQGLLSFDETLNSGSFFDWLIATPEATADVLELQACGKLLEKIEDRKAYQLDGTQKRLVNTKIPGLYFWHESPFPVLNEDEEALQDIINKYCYLIKRTFLQKNDVYLIWSNVQPNLKSAVEALDDGFFEKFFLTEKLYRNIKKSAFAAFCEPKVFFITRSEDCDVIIRNSGDVVLLNIDRSEDFQGPADLFKPVFDIIMK